MSKGFSNVGNPLLKKSFASRSSTERTTSQEGTMTSQGAINKTLILFGMLLVTGIYNYQIQSTALMIGGAVVGLGLVIFNVFKKEYSPYIAPAFAAMEGLFVGGISGYYAGYGGGIVVQAISLTLMVLFIMLFIHKTGIIPITQKFKTGVVMATGAIALLYLLSFGLSFFGIHMPFIHEGGTFGILFSLGVIGIASLNLLLDFDLIVKGEEYGAPKYMEWFSAMGLMITLIWLYLEILRLLVKLRD